MPKLDNMITYTYIMYDMKQIMVSEVFLYFNTKYYKKRSSYLQI